MDLNDNRCHVVHRPGVWKCPCPDVNSAQGVGVGDRVGSYLVPLSQTSHGCNRYVCPIQPCRHQDDHEYSHVGTKLPTNTAM